MKIGINALFLIPGKVGGSETYLRLLIRALQELPGSHEFIIYSNRENAGTFDLHDPRFREVRCPIAATNRIARMAYEQLAMPIHAARDRLDVLHSPGYTAPLLIPCANVVTIHDLNYHFHPEDWPRGALLANQILIPAVARAATHVITISESSRQALHDVLHVPSDKMTVTLHGADGNLVAPVARESLVERFGLLGPYILTVTASHPHKNVDGLFRAYEATCRDWLDPLPLVVVGIRGRDQERLEEIVRTWNGGGRIVFPGWVDAPTLAALYMHARVFAFASKYEGFGIPVLEAMSVDVPVVSSNRASLPEACGDAATLVDPDDIGAFAHAIRMLCDDEVARRDYIVKGRAHVAKFTWRRTAEGTLAAYARATDRNRTFDGSL